MADIDHQPTQSLAGSEAAAKVKELGEAAGFCMFVTGHDTFPVDARPMALQDIDEQGTVWFLSSSESEKNRDIQRDPRVSLLFQNNDKFQYLSLSGRATIHTDRALIDAHWTALANSWFDGKDDPRVTVIAVRPETGHYWETKNGKIVSGIKMALSALGADVDDGGREGALRF